MSKYNYIFCRGIMSCMPLACEYHQYHYFSNANALSINQIKTPDLIWSGV